MIAHWDRLFEQIAIYKPCRESSLSANEKIAVLDAAIFGGVVRVRAAFKRGEHVHLAYSGGVDSSIVLCKLVEIGASVIAHTMVNAAHHPDLVHARLVLETFQHKGFDVEHAVHILSPTTADVVESNRLLSASTSQPDNYYMLMKVLSSNTSRVVNCDCIDELLGGYHMHNQARDKFAALEQGVARLLPDHLVPLQKCSDHFGITVHLPYGDAEVMKACESFAVPELVDDQHRKKPIYEIASRLGVPNNVLARRKYGLNSAFHEVIA